MDDDQDQGDESAPIFLSESEEESSDHPPGPQGASPGESSIMNEDQDTPAESLDPESVSPERDTSMFVDQPSSPDAATDDAESSQPDEDYEEAQAEAEQPEGAYSSEDESDQDHEGSDHSDDSVHSDSEANDQRGPRGRPHHAGGQAACHGIECQIQCDHYEQRIRARDKEIEKLKRLLAQEKRKTRGQRVQIRELADQVRGLGAEPVHDVRRPGASGQRTTGSSRGMRHWQHKLREYLAGRCSYSAAWRESQRALNMPLDITKTHPGIRFVPKDGHDARSNPPPNESPIRAMMPPGVQLPDNVLLCILDHLLHYQGMLVHCISRLDYFRAPTSFPGDEELGEERTGIKGRLFFSKRQQTPVSITYDTLDPNTVLAPLLVSRKWMFYGVHVFFGKNTFSFSSIGEFGRAMNGFGAARIMRIQHIKICWVGGKVVRFDTGEPGKRLNARTLPLAWLCETKSLKTLAIHIEESNKNVVRRSYEPSVHKDYVKKKMAGKCQGRMTRALRCCHGMDYVTLLRGLHWFRGFDMDKQIKLKLPRNKSMLRDKSFVRDVESAVTQEKNESEAAKSSPYKLDRLFPARQAAWNPNARDVDFIRHIYEEDTGYKCRENDMDKDGTSSQGTIESDSSHSGDDDDESDDESDDDGDDDSSGSESDSPPAQSRRRRSFTPAPDPEEDPSENEEYSVSEDPDQSDSGSDSGDSDAHSATTEGNRRSRVNEYVYGGSQEPE